MTEAGENWVDVKELVTEAANELKLGELIHGENFHLGDAMCCLEVMHPKMDSGMSREAKVTLDSLLSQSAIPLDDTLPTADILGFVDQVLNCEMTYYQGQPAPQTVFTCLYLHRPLTLLKDPVVKALAVVALKTISVVRKSIQKADVFEEEDFVPQLFDFGLCDELTDVEALRMIKDAEELVSTKLSTASEEDKPLVDALLTRIRFRKQLYMAHIYLDKFSEKNYDLARKCLTAAQSEFEKLKATASLAKIPQGVFDERVTRHIMTSSPPRTTTIIPQEKTFAYFDEQLKHLLFVCNFPKIEPAYPALSEYYIEFSYLIPDTVARSKLHANFLITKKVMGVVSQIDFAVDAMKRMGIPPHFFDKLDAPEMENVAKFSDRVGTVLFVYFKFLVHNRSRLRRKITHLLDDFTVLQGEADELDDEFRRNRKLVEAPRAFGIYIMELKLRLMTYHNNVIEFCFISKTLTLTLPTLWLNLGFELDLYPREEYSMVYWYLDYIQANNVGNQSNLIELSRKETVQVDKKGGKNKKQVAAALKHAQTLATSFFIPHYLLASNLYMSKGIFKLLEALQKLGYITPKQYPYGDTEVRFLKRFSIFQRVQFQPQPLFFHHFEQVARKDIHSTAAEVLLNEGANLFQQAKLYLEKVLHNTLPAPSPSVVVEVKTLLRVAVTNTLQCQMLLKNLTQEGKKSDSLTTFNTHHYYPIVTLPK